jgi:hypothetical protein
MRGWYIFLLLLLLLAILLFTPAKLHVVCQTDGTVFRLSFLGVPLYRSGRRKTASSATKKKRNKKEKTPRKKKKSSSEKQKEKRSLTEKLSLVNDVLSSIGKGLRTLTKGIHIRHLTVAVAVGDFDASACALAYGKLQAVLYPCLAALGSVFTVTYDSIQVDCCFGQTETRYHISGTVQLSIARVIAAAFGFGIAFLQSKTSTETT